MSPFESLVDPAEFGGIADYLRAPGDIHQLLYVKSRELLAPLAEELDRQRRIDRPPWAFPAVVQQGLREGSLLISARSPRDISNPKLIVDAAAIPRSAICHVIYAPPFYLVHARGLFEGTLVRPTVKPETSLEIHLKRSSRIKP